MPPCAKFRDAIKCTDVESVDAHVVCCIEQGREVGEQPWVLLLAHDQLEHGELNPLAVSLAESGNEA